MGLIGFGYVIGDTGSMSSGGSIPSGITVDTTAYTVDTTLITADNG